jgi:hypothetical protein
MSDQAKCKLCGEPMPPGEEMFKYHGYSGNCPKPPVETGKAVVPSGPLPLLLAMARDWTDPVVVRDAPDRAADVIAQLIGALQSPAPHAGLIAEIEQAAAECEDLVDFHRGISDGLPTEHAESDETKAMDAAAKVLRRCQSVLQSSEQG